MEFKGYSSLWKAVVRPPRFQYEQSDLGPEVFDLNHVLYKRTDLKLKNKFGHNIECSHFEPEESYRQWDEMPCIIYMHGNSSSRLEALEAAPYLLPSNMTLFCFDFAGCGNSEGEYISLGWHERDDLNQIVEYLRKERRVSTIGLWGRSMGSVTALLHGDRDPSIAGMVLDSPFSNMKILVNELAKRYTKIPSLLVSGAMKLIRGTIKSKANFDVHDLSPIDHVSECFIPALFACATGDDFILPHHTQDLFDKYAGDKNIVKFEGDHNSSRPDFFFNSVVIFFHNTLQVDVLCREDNKLASSKSVSQSRYTDFDVDDDENLDYPSMPSYFANNGNSMGANPINEEELKNAGLSSSSSNSQQQHRQGSAYQFSNQDEENEEEILRRVMEESLKQHEEEEEKRGGSVHNNGASSRKSSQSSGSNKLQQSSGDDHRHENINDLLDINNPASYHINNSNINASSTNNTGAFSYPLISNYGQNQVNPKFQQPMKEAEEDYLLQCMQKMELNGNQSQVDSNLNHQINSQSNLNNSQQQLQQPQNPQKSIDDLLNM